MISKIEKFLHFLVKIADISAKFYKYNVGLMLQCFYFYSEVFPALSCLIRKLDFRFCFELSVGVRNEAQVDRGNPFQKEGPVTLE